MKATKAIVTGHSRGLGAAIAGELLERGIPVLGLARRGNAELAAQHGDKLAEVAIDLADSAALAAWLAGGALGNWMADAQQVLLVNNAGTLQPMGPLALQEVDAVAWDYPEAAFDFVVGIFIQFADPAQRARMFAGMARALRPGGHLIVQGYAPKQLEYRTGGPSAVENLYTADLLRTAFPDLEIVHLQEYEDVLDEGLGHKGQSALVGLVARKPAA